MTRLGTMASLGLIALLAAEPSGAGEWHVDGDADNSVEFTSEVVGVLGLETISTPNTLQEAAQ